MAAPKRKIRPLQEWIPAVTPEYHSPVHLVRLTDLFQRIAAKEVVEAVVNAPPRHEKTESALHGLGWLLVQDPTLRIAYVSYSQRYSESQSRRLRHICGRAGVALDNRSKSLASWSTGAGGEVWATSAGGALTGKGFNVILLDDTVKDRATAESPIEREKAVAWYGSTLYTRREPGASIIDLQTRWHAEDLAGHLIKDGFEHIRLPAIDDEGRALCPSRYSIADLEKIREAIGQYSWLGLYQGIPPTRGGQVFQDAHIYDSLPANLRYSVGCDFAYSKQTKADYSVAVVLGHDQTTGLSFVVEVVRLQVLVADFKIRLNELCSRYPGVKPFVWTGGQEKGIVELLNQSGGCQIRFKPAVLDKFSRSQPASGAWNAGKILVPRSAPWLNDFVSEIVSFTGSDRHDDQVDALSAAYEYIDVGRRTERARIRRAHDYHQLDIIMSDKIGASNEVFDWATGRTFPNVQAYRWELQRRKLEGHTEEEKLALLQGKILPGSKEAVEWNRIRGLPDDFID